MAADGGQASPAVVVKWELAQAREVHGEWERGLLASLWEQRRRDGGGERASCLERGRV